MSLEITKKIEEIDELTKKEAYEEAEQVCKGLLSNYPNDIDVLLKLGKIQILSHIDSIEPALSTFNQALSLDPNNPVIISELARVYYIHDQSNEARNLVRKALELNPECASAWAVQGLILADIDKQYDEAFQAFEKALSLDLNNYWIWFWYGLILVDGGYISKGIQSVKRADALHPGNAGYLSNLSNMLIIAGDYKESIGTAKKALTINPECNLAKLTLGFSLAKIGEYYTAIEFLTSVKDKLTDEGMRELGNAYNQVGKFQDSLNIFNEILNKKQDNVDILVYVGVLHMNLKEYETALEYFNKSLVFKPDDEYAHLNIWLLLNETGKAEEAKGYLTKHQITILCSRLKRHPEPGASWQWLDGRPADKKGANKFLLCSSVDGYQPWKRALEQSTKFADETLSDPDNLWDCIVTKFTEKEWKTQECKKEYGLHHVLSWHNRVYDIANRVVKELDGDARKIWRKGDPEKPLGIQEEYDSDTILDRLDYFMFGSPKYTDKQIPRMVLGALLDSEQALGPADPKADTHVIRVVGRVVYGIEDLKKFIGDQKIAENIAIHTARLISPDNPWYVDQQLFAPGALDKICVHSSPKCDKCGYNSFCFYNLGLKKEIPTLPERLPSLTKFQKERGIITK